MKDTQSKHDTNGAKASKPRRSFLRKSALAAGGLAGAATLPGEVLADVENLPEKETQQAGYRLTEHIAEYYKTAKL